jgi:hypothetical protein
MKTILAGLGVCAILAVTAVPKSATALPAANLGAGAATTTNSDVLDVRYGYWRGGHWRGGWGPRYRWGPRYGYWGPRYGYGAYPYYRRYYGPHFYVGPRGFRFGVW